METIERSKDRDEWLSRKVMRIGSSDARAILGCGYEGESEATVFDRMVYGISKNFSSSHLDLLQEGRIMEPAILRIFETRNTDWLCEPSNGFELRVSKEHPYLCCTLDCHATHRISKESIAIEAKFEPNALYEEYQDNRVPLKHYVQVQHQLICTGWKGAFLVSLMRGRYQQRWIQRDEPLIEQMLIAYANFMDKVRRKERPSGQPAADYRVIVANSDPQRACILGKEASQQARELLELQDRRHRIESRLKELKLLVARTANGCNFLVLDDERVVRIGRNGLELRSKGLPRGIRVQI